MVEVSLPTAGGAVKKKAYHHGNLRNAIIQEATARARALGEKAIVLREIAPVIGVSATAAYRHFASRQKLVEEVSARGYLEMRERVTLPAVSGSDADPRLGAYLDMRNAAIAMVRFAVDEPAWARMMMETVGEPGPVAAAVEQVQDVMQGLVNRGIAAGTFKPGVEVRDERVLWAGIDGLACHAMFGIAPMDTPEADDVTARTIDLCLTDMLTEEGLRARDAAALPNRVATAVPRSS